MLGKLHKGSQERLNTNMREVLICRQRRMVKGDPIRGKYNKYK